MVFWRKDTRREIQIDFIDDQDIEIKLTGMGIMDYPEEKQGYLGEHEMILSQPHYMRVYYYLIEGKIVAYTYDGLDEKTWKEINRKEMEQAELDRRIGEAEGELPDEAS